MADVGLLDLDDPVLERAARANVAIVVEAARASSALRAAAIIDAAAEKAASTVAAISYYSRSSSLDRLERLRPSEEIETVLKLYYGKIRRSVAVERSFCDDDDVLGYRDSLKEVWVNLINNALQAMEYSGRLGLSTSREDEWVAVSISDSGPGIPEEIRGKIFTPFFTTKAPGEGTGIGLDICKRIVSRHGGTISFASGTGGTTFTVRLTAAPMDSPAEESR